MIITPFNVCKFKFIGLFNHIIWLQYIQEQSRQTLLPGMKLSYDYPPLLRGPHFVMCQIPMPAAAPLLPLPAGGA